MRTDYVILQLVSRLKPQGLLLSIANRLDRALNSHRRKRHCHSVDDRPERSVDCNCLPPPSAYPSLKELRMPTIYGYGLDF
jgi:hypothetical protein